MWHFDTDFTDLQMKLERILRHQPSGLDWTVRTGPDWTGLSGLSGLDRTGPDYPDCTELSGLDQTVRTGPDWTGLSGLDCSLIFSN